MYKLYLEIKDGFMIQIFWMIFGAIITIVSQKIGRSIMNGLMRNQIKKGEITLSHESMISLDHGDPSYKIENIIFKDRNLVHRIPFPEEKKKEISNLIDDFSFYKYEPSRLISGSEITDLSNRIEKHSDLVADDFIQKIKEGTMIFNGKKFGISKLNIDRKGEHEESRVFIEYYETDYFTHQVFRSIYKELKEEKHPISYISTIQELNRYPEFLTSFGINALIILDNLEKEEVVLTERSGFLSNMSGEKLWHVTMNEGLSMTDINQGEVSVLGCLNRGMREELGIREDHHEKIILRSFNDLFMNMDHFEIGLTALVKLSMTIEYFETLHESAQDGNLESTDLISIPVQKKAIKAFLSHHKTTKACDYVLKMHLARTRLFW